jgi:EAL domain-containing protein (putative c-di-GMP-specific phosphodiesterase class I)
MPSKKSMQSKPGALGVLVIESTKFQRRSLCRLIRAAGADHVAEAVDIADAARVLGRGRYPEWIVVADPDLMPEPAFASLKALTEQYPVAGALLLTNRKGVFDELRMRAREAELRLIDVLRKPISAEEMGTLLRQFALASNNAVARPQAISREELSECLRSGAVRARFMPRIDLDTGHPACCEAIPYIAHPTFGAVPAERFSHAVAQLGAQRVMTASVLRDAAELVRQLRDWDLDAAVAVGIGIEVLSESSDAASLDAYVRTLGITSSDLSLEVSAGSDVVTDHIVADNLARLKLRGYRLVLREDSNVAALTDPVYAHFSEIKLRRGRSPQQAADAQQADRIASLLSAAGKHGMAACAVDVQPGADLGVLRRDGFDFAQGEYFVSPMSIEETLHWIARVVKSRHYGNRPASQPLAS